MMACFLTYVRVPVDRAWLQEMTAIITSDELGKDVSSAEALINRHKEHRTEIDTRLKDFTRFSMTGKQLIADGHFLSQEVRCGESPSYSFSFIRSNVYFSLLFTFVQLILQNLTRVYVIDYCGASTSV